MDLSDCGSAFPVAVRGVGGVGTLANVVSLVGSTSSTSTSRSGTDAYYCAILSSGGVDCWGSGYSGQLGDGVFRNSDFGTFSCTEKGLSSTCGSALPVPVSGVGGIGQLSGVVSITMHQQGMCALLTSGGVDCWGAWSHGELGNGARQSALPHGSATPTQVVGVDGTSTLTGVSSLLGINAAPWFAPTTCAVLASGGVDCWGANDRGQLGGGVDGDSALPVAVVDTAYDGGYLTGVSSLADSQGGICARLTSGGVDCWGDNSYGQLGLPVNTQSWLPAVGSNLSGVTAIDAGGFNTCALVSGGTVKCWGYNYYGELGNGTTSTSPPYGSTVPVSVTGLTGATAISTGNSHTCALLSGGTVKCWGYNYHGELGNGTTSTSPPYGSTVPVSVTGLTGATAIAAGSAHTCALITGGTVKCWGGNGYGELGDGTTTDSTVPVSVTGLTGATAISTGDSHTCALLSGGTVQCWGWNNDGQLGNGTRYSATAPVSVTGLTGVIAIAAGYYHTCALLSGGTVQCWGNNGGQLGDGTTTDSTVPVSVGGLTGAAAIGAGYGHTCAVISGGTVQCWGMNYIGELGNGTNTDSNVPVTVTGLTGVTAIAAGLEHTCALLSGGTVQCWGDNHYGELGTVGHNFSSVPVALKDASSAGSLLEGVSSLTATGPTLCALLATHQVQCWGYNGSGQLGNGEFSYTSGPSAVLGIGGTGVLGGVASLTPNDLGMCALLTTGQVDCWGDNTYGLLGDGDFNRTAVPVSVVGIGGVGALNGVSSLAATTMGMCAILATSQLNCWGKGIAGALGNGIFYRLNGMLSDTGSAVPVAVLSKV